MLNSLSRDIRVQHVLKHYANKLLEFILHLQSKGDDYLQRLNLPVFKGSLLLEHTK